jgi:hypothetical protein
MNYSDKRYVWYLAGAVEIGRRTFSFDGLEGAGDGYGCFGSGEGVGYRYAYYRGDYTGNGRGHYGALKNGMIVGDNTGHGNYAY